MHEHGAPDPPLQPLLQSGIIPSPLLTARCVPVHILYSLFWCDFSGGYVPFPLFFSAQPLTLYFWTHRDHFFPSRSRGSIGDSPTTDNYRDGFGRRVQSDAREKSRRWCLGFSQALGGGPWDGCNVTFQDQGGTVFAWLMLLKFKFISR